MPIKEFKDKVRRFIGNSKTDEAIEVMEIFFREQNNVSLMNDLAVIKGNYTDSKKKDNINIVSFDDSTRHKNQIHIGLLNVCGSIEDAKDSHIDETKAACKAAYGLLLYLSENTNAKAVFFEDANKNYFLRKPQGEEFIEKLPDLYLTQGHGMYLPKEVVEDFYIFRAKVYKIIDHAQFNNNDNDLIQVTNPGIKKLVKVLSERLSKNLKKYF